MLLYLGTVFAVACAVSAGPTFERSVDGSRDRSMREVEGTESRNVPDFKDFDRKRVSREVGGAITRSFGKPYADERIKKEVGGAITRNFPQRRDTQEIWTVVQSSEENLVMDNIRGKDVPLSLTEDFRGIIPVVPQQNDKYNRLYI